MQSVAFLWSAVSVFILGEMVKGWALTGVEPQQVKGIVPLVVLTKILTYYLLFMAAVS